MAPAQLETRGRSESIPSTIGARVSTVRADQGQAAGLGKRPTRAPLHRRQKAADPLETAEPNSASFDPFYTDTPNPGDSDLISAKTALLGTPDRHHCPSQA